MGQLDDRLRHIESRVDEMHDLLLKLIELQEATLYALRESGSAEQSAAAADVADDLLDESYVPRSPEEVAAEVQAILAETDPREIQYTIAINWADDGGAEDLTEFDLSGRNLRNIDLKDATLERADLNRADLTGAKLYRANLTGADLSRAQLSRADLSRATLTEADLTFAHLTYAKLDSANLRYATLTRANLSGANLSNCDLGAAQLNRANLTRANLQNAQVHRRQLAAASSLDGATMPDGRLYDGDPEPWKPEG